MNYKQILNDNSVVMPELYPVSSSEIDDMGKDISFPPDLVECWLQIGCGFFSRDSNGRRVTNFQNRLIGPDEILELKEGGAYPDGNPFEVGLPFFETADMRYLVLRQDGSIVHQSGHDISEDLPSFLSAVVSDPEFWLKALKKGRNEGTNARS